MGFPLKSHRLILDFGWKLALGLSVQPAQTLVSLQMVALKLSCAMFRRLLGSEVLVTGKWHRMTALATPLPHQNHYTRTVY